MALGIDDPRSDSLRVPPHSVEAEESVLGAVLLDSDAANIAMEKLQPEVTIKPAHGTLNVSLDTDIVLNSSTRMSRLMRSPSPRRCEEARCSIASADWPT